MRTKNLTSLIVLTFNNFEYNKLCIDSILQNTSLVKTPFEIIIVDNASTDGTREYLQGLEKSGQIRVIQNEENLGYPKAINQGVAIAKGEYLCLLNNDIVLSEEWLEKMLRCIKSDSKLAAVGPYTSYSSGRQAAQGYTFKDIDSLNKFSSKFNGEEKYVDFLVFFNCLIKRSVWDEIGGLSEEYGMGNFEDAEFCWRALEKGYKLKVCNCYIYHFGGLSFGYKKDAQKQRAYVSLLAKNQKIFLKRIGQYKTISLCMIVADSEKPQTLKRCLDSVAEWVDYINIVFNYKRFPKWTAKEDYDRRIFPKKFKKVLYDLPCDFKTKYLEWTDFSEMRNESLDMAKSDYIIWLDADDFLTTAQGLRDMILRFPDIDYFQCQVNSYKENRNREVIKQNRLFKNKKEYRFRNSVHEDVSFSMMEVEAKKLTTNITINHLGNLNFKDVLRKNKRNMKLILKDMSSPDVHSLTYFGYVNCLLLTQKKENFLKAIKCIDESFKKFNFTHEDPLNSKMWVIRGGAALMYWKVTKQHASLMGAKQSFLKAWDEWKHPEAVIGLSEIYSIEGEWDKVISVLTEFYDLDEIKTGNIPIDLEEIILKTLQYLGDAWGRKAIDADKPKKEECLKKAEEYYSKYLTLRENNILIADRMCQILRNTGRLDDAAFLSIKLVNRFPNYYIGYSNLGAYEISYNRFHTARLFLKEALRINPKHKDARHNLKMIENVLKGKRK